MMLKSIFMAFIPIFALASSIIVLTFLSQFPTTISVILHNYTVLAFRATNPTTNNITNLTPPNNTIVNHPPVANAGINQIVNETDTVILNGIASDPDPDDNKLSYSWKQIAGPGAKLQNGNTTNPSFTAPTVQSDRDLKFMLTAKDENGAQSTNSAIVIVTVKHVNQHPVANVAQENQIVNPGDIVTLDGGKSTDPDSSDSLSYLWTQMSGPTVKLDSANSPIATFTAPSNISKDTTLVFKLTIKDSKNATGKDDTKVTDKYVPPINKRPLANAGKDQTVNETDIVHLDGTKSRDPDGNITSYSWKQIGGSNVTINGANKPNASFTAPSNISSTSTILLFKLTVTDNKNVSGISTVKITVKPVNHPPVANAGTDQTVNANTTVTLDGSTSSDGDGSIAKYSWTQTAGPAVTLNDADTSRPSFTAPNVSSDTELKFSLVVTDDKGAVSNNSATVSVTVKAAISKPQKSTAPINQANVPAENEYVYVRMWGSGGTEDGQFNAPRGIAVDSSGDVYVADGNNNRIQKFDSNGKFITTWGQNGEGQFSAPSGVAVDSSGNVYVTDNFDHRIQKFDSNGKFITTWGSSGAADGQFNGPNDIAADSSGNVYVTDANNNRIQKFDSNGKFITKWGSKGTGDGQFNNPTGIAVDSSGNVYVVDYFNHRIQKFDSNGKFITKWGSKGTGDGQFDSPGYLVVDLSGNVYVTDDNRIQKFDSNGKFITKWGSKGTGDGQFVSPNGIALDSSGNVYVSEFGNDRIQVFAPSHNASR